jgi:nucleoside-diphosphate-sugar epimerase
VLLNLALQPPNTLLHDGHLWKRYTPARIVAETEIMLADPAHRRADLIVHASYAFLRAVEQGAQPGPELAPIDAAALAAEEMVLGARRPACVVRLGYLYGPESKDLRAYRTAFRLGRPYWAGPKKNRQHHLHTADAARALGLAAEQPPQDPISYATDERPASFQDFMDHFAHLVGNPLPTHLWRISRPFAHVVVGEEHMEMVELGVKGQATPQVSGFDPRYRDYREGLAQVITAWESKPQ